MVIKQCYTFSSSGGLTIQRYQLSCMEIKEKDHYDRADPLIHSANNAAGYLHKSRTYISHMFFYEPNLGESFSTGRIFEIRYYLTIMMPRMVAGCKEQ